ncbi:MAG: hypothetical protein QOK15_3712 [Nocardioidaceae bacterium]|nr:hypothetical protein [Nocardioidaceae bacterium]
MRSVTSDWTFLSNYGHVLVCLAGRPDARMRDIAEAVGITERAVQQIVRELVGNGYVEKQKDGRRNRYRIVRSAHFRHPLESTVTLGDFLDLALRGAR